MAITYRPAAEADFDFLFALHEAAMRPAVEAAYGAWEDAWQRAYFRRYFDPALLRVIQWDGQDVGFMQVQSRTEELFLADIEILPAFQSRGIGSAVIGGLQEQARSQNKLVALQVLKINTRARQLYQRLGFTVTGETQTHYIMASEKV